jgi:EmrB/QacA subfamily drug resistance transporter
MKIRNAEPKSEGHGGDGQAPWTALLLLCVAQFMVVLDITVSNVALPSIADDLSVSAGDLQWVITAYVLLAGGLLLLGGRAADVLGRRRVFIAGLATFTFASLLSGVAWSPDSLIAFRALQGLGAAMLTPSALSLIATIYTGPQHKAALTVWGAIGSAGAAAGMLVGGVLTEVFGWQAVYLINVPVGIAVGLAVPGVVPAMRGSVGRGIKALDLPGALLLVTGLAGLIYAIQGASDHGWDSAWTIGRLLVAAVTLTCFALVERRVSEPVVPPRIRSVRSLVSGATIMVGATGILVGTFFLSTLYLQEQMGSSSLETGLQFLPIAAAIAAGAHVAAHLMSGLGSKLVAASGLVLVAMGCAYTAATPDHASYAADLLPGFIALGLGVGLVFPSASITGMSEISHDTAGLFAGVMTTAHEVGAAIGVAVLASVAASATSLTVGFEVGFHVAAVVSLALAVVAAWAVPTVKPAPGTRLAAH